MLVYKHSTLSTVNTGSQLFHKYLQWNCSTLSKYCMYKIWNAFTTKQMRARKTIRCGTLLAMKDISLQICHNLVYFSIILSTTQKFKYSDYTVYSYNKITGTWLRFPSLLRQWTTGKEGYDNWKERSEHYFSIFPLYPAVSEENKAENLSPI